MSEPSGFDERLTAVLTAEADDAPHSAGLAQAARRRHVVRRRRRIAVGGVAAALVIAAPVAVLAGGSGGDNGDERVGNDPTTAPTVGWQTVSEDGVEAEIPGDWSKYTCDFDGFERDVYGPSEEDACGFGAYLAFYVSATFDPAVGPGIIIPSTEDGPAWGGYVYAGEWAISSSTPAPDLTRQILATARLDEDPKVDVAEWRTVEGVGIRIVVPKSARLGPQAEHADFFVCVLSGRRNVSPDREPQRDAEDFYTSVSFVAGRWVSVAAPTQALQDLVMAKVVPIDPSSPDRPIGCVS